MSKARDEALLVKEAIRVGNIYAQNRGVGKFELTDSANDKVEYIYQLLLHDKLIEPLAKGQETLPNMKHKLALWIKRQLPKDHPLNS